MVIESALAIDIYMYKGPLDLFDDSPMNHGHQIYPFPLLVLNSFPPSMEEIVHVYLQGGAPPVM